MDMEISNSGSDASTTSYRTCPESPRDACGSCFDCLDALQKGDSFAEKYIIRSGKKNRRNNVRFASFKYASKKKVVLKFFETRDEMIRIADLHAALSDCEHVCSIVDVVEAGDEFPSCLVFERGDYTLRDWINRLKPDSLTQKSVLYDVARAVYSLHRKGICHGDLKTDNIVWFTKDYIWKLIDLDAAARCGERRRICYTVAYASPEVVQVAQAGWTQMEYTMASDMWSLGVIAYEILTGTRYYSCCSMEVVNRCLSGASPLPSLDALQEPQSHRLVSNLLCTDPMKRWTADKVHRSSLFRSADDTVQTQTKMLEVNDHLNRLYNQMMTVLSEVQSSNLMVQLTVEYFRSWTKPTEPFHIRETAKAFSIQDEELLDNPVWILRIGCEYRLNISITHRHLPVNIDRILDVRLITPERNDIRLEKRIGTEEIGTYTVVAHLDLREISSDRLSILSPNSGGVGERYVRLGFVVDVVMTDSERHKVELGGIIFCKMVPSGNRQLGLKLARAFRRSYSNLPPWTKDAVKGSCFVAELVMNLAPALL